MKKCITFFAFLILYHSHSFSQNWLQLGSDFLGDTVLSSTGAAVGLSSDGNTLAIGSTNMHANGNEAGYVSVYSRNGSTWIQKGQDIFGEVDGDRAGGEVMVSADGNTLAITSRFNDGNGIDAGHVRVFTWNKTKWLQKGEELKGDSAGDRIGYALAMSSDGNTVAMGAPTNASKGVDAGQVKVFSWNGSTWTQKGNNLEGEATNDLFGSSVTLSSDGNILAIGAQSYLLNGKYLGQVKVYSWNGSSWFQLGKDLFGHGDQDRFGYSNSISSDGKILAVGAATSSGKIYFGGSVEIFEWDGTGWGAREEILYGDSKNDLFGSKVILSSNGNTLAVSAPYDSSNGKGAGQVRVYFWDDSTWIQKGIDLDGQNTDDYFGDGLAMNSNGDVIAVGARNHDGNGNNSGLVRVFGFGWNSGFNVKNKTKFKVYPNPSNGHFTIDLGQSYQSIELSISNLLGQNIVSKKIVSAKIFEFEIIGHKGIYFIQITATHDLKTRLKVIKE